MRITKEGQSYKAIKIIKKLLTFFIVLFGVIGITIAAIIFFSDDNGLFGYGAKIVLSSSMEKNPNVNVGEYKIKDIPVGSLIIVEFVPFDGKQQWYAGLREGDVVTFVYNVVGGSITIAHRIIKIEKGENGFKFTLAGDNSDDMSTQTIYSADENSKNHITGKVVYSSYLLGLTICEMRDPVFVATILLLVLVISILRAYKTKSDILPER